MENAFQTLIFVLIQKAVVGSSLKNECQAFWLTGQLVSDNIK